MRRFADRPLEFDVLSDILNCGRWTGSAKNTQPWHLVVVRDRSRLEQLAKLGRWADHLAGAAAGIALVMSGPEVETGFDEGRLAQNLMLGAWAHGVGSCIASLFPRDNREEAKRLLEIPGDRDLRNMVSLGYPLGDLKEAAGAVRSVLPMGRDAMDHFASWEAFGRREP